MSKVKSIEDIVQSHEDILGGTPVFKGTRVPVEALFDYLRHSSLEEFFKGYPQVPKRMVRSLLELMEKTILSKKPSRRYENAA